MTPKPGRYGALPVWNTLHLVLGVLILAGLHEGTAVHACRPLTKELLQGFAKNNTIMVNFLDKIAWAALGPSWAENCRAANISYYVVIPLDPHTSKELAAAGEEQCANPPPEALLYKGTDSSYVWGSNHWKMTTWNKVHVSRHVYRMGFHVVQSDGDVVWFRDPMPYFSQYFNGPAHFMVSGDHLGTANPPGDHGLEQGLSEVINLNSGVWFARQWPDGVRFFDEWLKWADPEKVGHDQDGLNFLLRGASFHRDADKPQPRFDPGEVHRQRVFHAAYLPDVAVGMLPSSMFGNSYTYVNARLHEKLNHTLYEVHWVWGGNTLESKRQNMRDAQRFHDPPEYYSGPRLLTFDLVVPQAPAGFNAIPLHSDPSALDHTERMVRYHVAAANAQLRQAYWAFAAALALNRTLVLPRFQCFCSKNWYQTQACRINYETLSTFPFTCSLSQLLRARKLLSRGLALPPGMPHYQGHHVDVREYSFLENPKVPQELKQSWMVVEASTTTKAPGTAPEQLVLSKDTVPAGQGPHSLPGSGQRLTVAAKINDLDLQRLMEPYDDVRVVHIPRPGELLRGFAQSAIQDLYDKAIQEVTTYWCCRSPPDMQRLNRTANVQLVALPLDRYDKLVRPVYKGAEYLHDAPPLPGAWELGEGYR